MRMRTFVLIVTIGLALPPTLMANECVLSTYASPIDPTYSRSIEDLDHLRASNIRKISWWTPCDASKAGCLKGKSGEKIYEFDKQGRLTRRYERIFGDSSSEDTFTYAGSNLYPISKTTIENSSFGKSTRTHFTLGRDGALHLAGETNPSSRDYRQGDAIISEALSPEMGLRRVTYRNGLLTEQVSGGGLQINTQTLATSHSPSNTDVTTIRCERKTDPKDPNQTIVTEHTKHGAGAAYVSAWSKLDSLGRTVENFNLGWRAEEIQKGLGTGSVSHYADIDGKGNWQTVRTCAVHNDSEWETGSGDCWGTRRSLEYYSGNTKR